MSEKATTKRRMRHVTSQKSVMVETYESPRIRGRRYRLHANDHSKGDSFCVKGMKCQAFDVIVLGLFSRSDRSSEYVEKQLVYSLSHDRGVAFDHQ